jgi:hypothetical protein
VATGTVEYLGTVSALTGLSTTAAKGDFYRVLTAFTVGSETAHVGDILIATKDNPAQTAADWDVIHAEVDSNTWVANTATAAGYVAAPGANVANKVWKTDSTGAPGWRDDANTDTGATSVEVTGTGNAVTGATYDAGSRKLTLTKGATYSSFPIGSVIMTHKELASGETSAAANPATLLGLPGTWTLIDKEFKSSVSSIGGPGNEVSPAGTGFYLSGETAIRTDHTILLQIGVSVSTSSGITAKPNVEAITMATLRLARYGISGLERSTGNEIAFATDANGTSGAICYYITKEGVLTLHDVLGGAGNRKLNNNTFMYINTVIPIIDHTLMIDSFCDKFYWKRTA